MGTIQYGQFESVVDVMIRQTESSDIRITEAGDTRITNDAIGNTGEGSLVAEPTLIPLVVGVFNKVNGVWKMSTPYVKDNGSWKQPNAIYKKDNGIWKRVY